MPKALKEFLTPAEVGKLLGCSAQRVRDLEREGLLVPDGKTRAGWRLFAPATVEAYLAKKKRRAAVDKRQALDV